MNRALLSAEFQLAFHLGLDKLNRFVRLERLHELWYGSLAVDINGLEAREFLVAGLRKKRPNIQGSGLPRQSKYSFTLRLIYTGAQFQVKL
jgi:hypothetical protein